MTARIIESEPPAPAPPRYTPITLDDLNTRPDPDWLVEHWCMRQAVTFITGESESFKTFLAMDLAMTAATDGHFGPHHIDRTSVGFGPMRVLYVIGESIGAAKFRFTAIKQHRGLADYPDSIRVFPDRVDLREQAAEVKRMVDDFDPDIVVFDTFSRNTAGLDENSGKDVAIAMGVAHDLKMGGTRGGRSVVFIHHPAKAGNSPYRGHTSLLNDTDIMIELERHDKRTDKAEYEFSEAPFYTKVMSKRQKETDDFRPYYAKLDTHIILDDSGHPIPKISGDYITSLVVTSVDESPPDTPAAPRVGKYDAGILAYVAAHPGAIKADIQKAVTGKTGSTIYRYVEDMVVEGRLVQEGRGLRLPEAPPLDELPAL